MARQLGWPYKKEFQCHRCGNCCRGDGHVTMTSSDVAKAARFLNMTEQEFIGKFCFPGDGDTFELHSQGDPLESCIMLFEEKGLFGCKIHGAKPDQCAAFPFGWRPNDAVDFCSGIRALEGLGPSERKTMSRNLDRKLRKEGL